MGIFDFVTDAFNTVKNTVSDAVTSVTRPIFNTVTGIVKPVFNAVSSVVKPVASKIYDAGEALVNKVVVPAANIAYNVGSKVLDKVDKLADAQVGFFQGLSNPFVMIALVVGAAIVLPPLLNSRKP